MKKILAIGAHPDDIEYAAFGYLYKEKLHGAQIYIVLLTDGGNSTSIVDGVRMKEEEKLCYKYGFEFIEFGRYKDGSLPFNNDSVKFIQGVIERIKPDEILTHYTNDTHQDHIATAKITLAASRYTNNILMYSSFSTLEFVPSIFCDITDYIDEKRSALECFSSQTKNNIDRNIDFVAYATKVNAYYGTKINKNYAEGFIPYRFLI